MSLPQDLQSPAVQMGGPRLCWESKCPASPGPPSLKLAASPKFFQLPPEWACWSLSALLPHQPVLSWQGRPDPSGGSGATRGPLGLRRPTCEAASTALSPRAPHSAPLPSRSTAGATSPSALPPRPHTCPWPCSRGPAGARAHPVERARRAAIGRRPSGEHQPRLGAGGQRPARAHRCAEPRGQHRAGASGPGRRYGLGRGGRAGREEGVGGAGPRG